MRKLYAIIPVFFLFVYSSFSQNCNDLEILTTTDASVCGEGSVRLSATSSATGNGILWYDSATGGKPKSAGNSFQTPKIGTTTSFWASEGIFVETAGNVGPVDPSTVWTGAGNGSSSNMYYMSFDVLQGTNLISVDIFPTSAVGSAGSIAITDDSGVSIANFSYTTTVTGGETAQTIPLNLALNPGTGYRMKQFVATSLFRNTSGAVFPYTSSVINITDNSFSPGYYFYFYNWKYSAFQVTCESPRKELIATVNNQADVDIASLPYTHSANTATYFNNYSSTPIPNCGAWDEYLYGNDVVYKYTANDNYILDVELSGLNKDFTGVFIYNSCDDIGDVCPTKGSFNENTGTHGFQVAVVNGNSYYFVVSSAKPTDSFNYTLTINGTTCANYPAPNGATNQGFITGQTLTDLDVAGPNITWYSNAAKTTVLPNSTVLVNATTYYATQTVLGCEGNLLAVTVTQVQCTALEVLSTTNNSVCGEGSVTLTAQGAGLAVNTDIYWYDAATGGNRVATGEVFETPVIAQATSYWASEVASAGMEFPGQGKPVPTGTSSFASTQNHGLRFDVLKKFTLRNVDVYATTSGTLEISLFDSTGTLLESTTKAVTAGSGAITVELNYQVPVGNGYRLLQTSNPSLKLIRDNSNNNFPYPLGNGGSLGSIIGGAFGPTSTSTNYQYFYNWTVFEEQAMCESPRKEVIATVNNVADEMVVGPFPFIHSESTSTYGNNYSGTPGSDCDTNGQYLNGNDVVYQFSPTTGAVYSVMLSNLSSNNAAIFVYESCYDIGSKCYAGIISDGTYSNFGLAEITMLDGNDYFIVISTKSSSSTDYTLTIDPATINCGNYTTAPAGDQNQFFETGDTIDDLVVSGGNLTWYSDATGTIIIPSTTLLVDASTYYVSQTFNTCESDLLAVTVTQIDCSIIEIISTTDGTIVCKGSTVLEAIGNGSPGTKVYWYDTPIGGNVISVGPSFTTPAITSTTSFWATEVFIESDAPVSGLGKVANTANSTYTPSGTNDFGLVFNATQSFTLIDVEVFSSGAGGDLTVELRDTNHAGRVLESVVVNVVGGGTAAAPISNILNLNFEILNAGTYYLAAFNGPSMIRDAGNNFFPYSLGQYGQITSGHAWNNTYPTSYFFFYNWTIGSGQVICESPRKEVVASISQDGDIIVPSALPYIDANNNTSNYGNTYSGVPGTTCGTTENYLNGDDVVYMYTATANEKVDIILKDINGLYAGIFVYESCAGIGINCVAGKVAGASQNDLKIKEFDMVSGQTYYIVVSSWLTSSIGYTLEIKGFDCTSLPAPVGDAIQSFVAPATLADLVVASTVSAGVLNWYSDAAGTISIPDTTLLVDATTYYVSQTFGSCEGPLLAITVAEIDCSNLNIVSTTGGTVTCKGTVVLSAISSGTGSYIYWYDAATGGNFLGSGATFQTQELTTTTSYWATEVLATGMQGNVGPLNPAIGVAAGSSIAIGTQRLYFDVLSNVTLESVDIYPTAAIGSQGSVTIRDKNQAVLYDIPYTTTVTGGTSPQTVTLNAILNPGIDYEIGQGTAITLTRNSSGAVYPYTSSAINITHSSFNPGYYYWFYNWKFNSATVTCESPRKVAIATVNQSGDKTVTQLNYSDTDSTVNFGNTFSGSPGCGINGNYLDGNDVVYRYTATANNILTIELTGVSNTETGVFVYESCGDVGVNCLGGTISNGGVYLIKDFYVTAGKEYFIVIASETGSTSYTLNIYGYDCATDLDAPTGDANQYFVGTKDLTNLDVDQYVHSTGLTWYSDAAGTTIIPNTTQMIDNTTYYVSQTVLGCESDLLAITVEEVACSDLEIVSTIDGLVCNSGSMTLTAQGSGAGNAIYWYAAATGGNPIGAGETFETPILSNTTSYWAEEVFFDGWTPLLGQGKTAPTGTSAFPSTLNYGLQFNATQSFTLESVDVYPDQSGTVEISLSDSAGNTLQTTSKNVSGGSGPVTVFLNFYISPGTGYKLLQTSNPSLSLIRDSSGNSFPYQLGAGGMYGAITNGTFGTSTSNSTTYYYFYNWTITTGAVLCNSIRTEVIAKVNKVLPPAPVVDATQEFCGVNNTVADLVAIGDNIKWYDNSGNLLSSNKVLQDGKSYFATQTIEACEGTSAEVVVFILDKSDKPVGDRNQTFYAGETLADLDVIGIDLLWYADQDKIIPLPETTILVDNTIYYVSQTPSGFCESDLLAIKVHRILGVNDAVFANVLVLPNPTSDKVTISNNGPIESVELYNLLGQRIITQSAGFQTQTTMDVSYLASGTYLLKVKIAGKTGIFKVIKE